MNGRILLIGPVPPPFGGARVSFGVFKDYLYSHCRDFDLDIRHAELPVRKKRGENPPGKVAWMATFCSWLSVLLRIRRCRSVIIFASPGGMWSYGLGTLIVAKTLRKECYLRFFGGRPLVRLNLSRLACALLCRTASWADCIVVQTRIAATEFPAFLQHKVKVVPGYRYRTAVSNNQEQDDKVVRFVTVGGLTTVKGITILLMAFRDLQSLDISCRVELHLFGHTESEIAEQIAAAKNVTYHGYISHTRLAAALPNYDILVFPSMYRNEGHPGVVIEALFAGIPTIVTDLPGPMEIVQDGVNGLVVKAGGVAELCGAMRRLAVEPAFRRSLASRAAGTAKQFDAELLLPIIASYLGAHSQ